MAMLRPGTFALDGLAGGIDGDRTALDRHVSAVAAGHRSTSRCLDGAGAVHHLRLSDRFRGRPDFLRTFVRPPWPQAGAARRHGALLFGDLALRALDLDRNAGRQRALQAIGGSGSIVLARAIVRDLYSGNRAGRELSLIASVMALAPVFAPIAGGALQSRLRLAFGILGRGYSCGLAGAAVVVTEVAGNVEDPRDRAGVGRFDADAPSASSGVIRFIWPISRWDRPVMPDCSPGSPARPLCCKISMD